MNTERFWQVPEFVIIGYKGSGKSSVLEILLGHPLHGGRYLLALPFNFQEPNLRPVQINFINASDCEHPKITMKWDQVTGGAEKVVSIEDLPLELTQRNK